MPVRRFSLTFAFLLGVLPLISCGGNDVDNFDHEIRVERLRFFPSDLTVGIGSRVRWVNIERKASDTVRTVTSGTGPDDPDAGMLFDFTLEGHAAGESEGGSNTYDFDEPGVFPYFTRLPQGGEFSGVIRVQTQ